MSLNAHTIIPRNRVIVPPPSPKKKIRAEKLSLSSFKELLQKKGLIDDSCALLYSPEETPHLTQYQEVANILNEPIDYVLKERNIPLTERSWLQQIHKEFPTIQFYLRGSRAARIIGIVEQFEALIMAFADPELIGAWHNVKKTIPHPPPPNDTDWFGRVKGLTSEKIHNRLVHVMADLAKTNHEEILQHGFQEKVIAQVTRFVRAEGNFAIASIGKEKKADILIGALKHPYLFPRDCFTIKLDQNWNPSIGKRKYFWQAVVDRLFGIVRLEPRHADNFFCFLAALEMKTKGCLIIENRITMSDLLAPFQDLPIEQLAERVFKRIENHHIDPFCYLFNFCSYFGPSAEPLWKALIPRFQHTLSSKFDPFSWKIYTLILTEQLSFAAAERAILKELERKPGFLPLFPRNAPAVTNEPCPLEMLFIKEAAFLSLEERRPEIAFAATTLFNLWANDRLNPHDETRLSLACNIPELPPLKGFRFLLTTELYQSALPFYLSLLNQLPPEQLYRELQAALRCIVHWEFLFNAFKGFLTSNQQVELICDRFTSLAERLLKLLQEGHVETFTTQFTINGLNETEAADLLEALPSELSDQMQWIKLQLKEILHQLTAEDLIRESQRFKVKNDRQVQALLGTALNHIDWIAQPGLYPLIVSQGIKIGQEGAGRLIEHLKSKSDRKLNHFLDALKLLSNSKHPRFKQDMQLVIQWIMDLSLFKPNEGYLLWPFVLECDYKNPSGLNQLVSPGKEVACLKNWVQLYRKNPSAALRKPLLMHLKDFPVHIVEIATFVKNGERKLEKFLDPHPSDDGDIRGNLLTIADQLLVAKGSNFVGLNLLLNLTTAAAAIEIEKIIYLYLRFVKPLHRNTLLPDPVIQVLNTLAEHFRKWQVSHSLMHAFVFIEPAVHPAPNMAVLAGYWAIALCDSKEVDLSIPEIESIFHLPVRSLDKFLLCYFKSHHFQFRLTHLRKFEFLVEAVECNICFEKDLSTRASTIAELLLASKGSFCEAIPQPLQKQLYDALFREMKLNLQQKNIQSFTELFYAFLWFSSSKTLSDFQSLTALEPGYTYLRTKLPEHELDLLDKTSADCLERLLSCLKKPESLECCANFLVDHFLLLVQIPRANDKYDNLIDISIPVMVFLNVDQQKIDNFIRKAIIQGYFVPGSWQRAFYLLLVQASFEITDYPIEKQELDILQVVLKDYLISFKKKPLIHSAMIIQCCGILHFMLDRNLIANEEQFFFGIDILNQVIFHYLAVLDKTEGDKFIKLSLNLFMKYKQRIDLTNEGAPFLLRMKSFLEEARALQAVVPLPTGTNRKYKIIYVNKRNTRT